MILSYRIELKPNKEQISQFFKHCGIARVAYNWALENHTLKKALAEREAEELGLNKPNYPKIVVNDWYKEFAILRDTTHAWIKPVAKDCWHEAFRNLDVAFKRFFTKLGAYPKMKKKGHHDSFKVSTTTRVGFNYIILPKIGKVRLKEKGYATNEEVKVSSITISREADRWFCSFYIKNHQVVPTPKPLTNLTEMDVVGVDLGIKDLAITSDGEVFKNPKAYNKYIKKMRRLQRKLSRQVKGSNSRNKTKLKTQKLHRRIANIRKDCSNKMTSAIVKSNPTVLVIESLMPANMSKNHKLANSILDASFGEIGRQFKYKCDLAGIHLIKAPRFYPSSQFCSCCGFRKKDLTLSDREWECRNCGSEHDRDFNASKNLQHFGLFELDLLENKTPRLEAAPSSGESYAGGDERFQFLQERCSSKKPEVCSQLKDSSTID